MKKIFILICITIWFSNSYSQSISSSVIGSAGSFSSNGGYSLSYTIGEPVVQTYMASGYTLNTGFQQGELLAGIKQLSLSLFLEGLYIGGGSMRKAQGLSGDQFPGLVADQISLELHSSVNPFTTVAGPYPVDLNIDGSASLSLSNAISSDYYLVIKHRNSLETWSSTPVPFNSALINYDFSNEANSAYGDNLIDLGEGKFGIYIGDANQDGIIDGDDLVYMDSDLISGSAGYLSSDLNGDGIVDGDDLVVSDQNITNGVSLASP
jgi:hypothetical protein